MAYADYRLCDRCEEKAFYDAELDYRPNTRADPIEPDEHVKVAGERAGYRLQYLGDWAVLCEQCAKTHRTAILPIHSDWRTVARDGMPPCDGETVFVGINTAGFACCFNEVTPDGVCSMQGPELSTVQMSGLQSWRVLDRPAATAEGKDPK